VVSVFQLASAPPLRARATVVQLRASRPAPVVQRARAPEAEWEAL
jgi:hypothetical protein